MNERKPEVSQTCGALRVLIRRVGYAALGVTWLG